LNQTQLSKHADVDVTDIGMTTTRVVVAPNGLEPYAYLRHVFTELPKAGTVEAIEALLPGDLKKDQIKAG
jgi:hypothetical protein